jgi:GLPGLI family protein
MKMKGIIHKLILICMVVCTASAEAQQLIFSGRITFERKENMHKQLAGEESTWSEEIKKRMPKYRTDQFGLSFTTNHSLYKLTQEDDNSFASWWRVAHNNTVKSDFGTRSFEANKNVYERDYRISDSLPVFEWKLLGEYRDVAGYTCRKASTIMMDSVYVIAFYTDEIPVSGGPELFNGLPGMILGVVIPRMNLTYFATKVESAVVPAQEFALPDVKRSKPVNSNTFREEILKAVKDWGEHGGKIYWKVML